MKLLANVAPFEIWGVHIWNNELGLLLQIRPHKKRVERFEPLDRISQQENFSVESLLFQSCYQFNSISQSQQVFVDWWIGEELGCVFLVKYFGVVKQIEVASIEADYQHILSLSGLESINLFFVDQVELKVVNVALPGSNRLV